MISHIFSNTKLNKKGSHFMVFFCAAFMLTVSVVLGLRLLCAAIFAATTLVTWEATRSSSIDTSDTDTCDSAMGCESGISEKGFDFYFEQLLPPFL
jgi:hypothetical protein